MNSFGITIIELKDERFIKPMICGFVKSILIELHNPRTGLKSEGCVLLISKKSTKRAGWRYTRRVVDDDGKIADFVQTGQYLILPKKGDVLQYRIIRGGIPLSLTQDPLKPTIEIERDFDEINSKFLKHVSNLNGLYKGMDIAISNLIERI